MINDIPPIVIISQAPQPEYAEVEIDNECYINLTKTFDTNCLDMGGIPFRSRSPINSNATLSGTQSNNIVSTGSSEGINFVYREGITPSIDAFWNNKAEAKFVVEEIRKNE